MLLLVTPPAAEPLLLDEAREHLRVDTDDEDALIASQLVAARMHIETITGRQLLPATWELQIDGFPDEPITLPRSPVISVESIAHLDGTGALQTLPPTDYQLLAGSSPTSDPAQVVPAFGRTWPGVVAMPNAVRVRFVAGYADEDAVPQPLKAAILLVLGDLYANREAQVPGAAMQLSANPAVEALLAPYRLRWF
jgi:uncharacterized phiE125 gp8 family phage protein